MDYLGIPIKKFLSGKCAPTNIYIHISDAKYIKVVNRGGEFEKNRLSNYQNHEVRELFIHASDLDAYINYCLDLIKKILSAPDNKQGLDIFTTCRFGEFYFLDLKFRGVHKSTLQNGLTLLDFIEKLIQRKPSLNKFILEVLDVDENIAKHALTSAFFSTLLVQGMRWRSIKNIETVFLSALFQDIGLLNHSQKSDYEVHSEIGSQIIQKSGFFKDYKIADIIAQHHELPDGSGFPLGYSAKEIYPMALPLIMASRLASLVLEEDSPLKDRTYNSAVRYLQNREERFYPPTYWEGLQTWINVGLAE
jgi:HD-GYP domain-containing protein (c-di-GMP phosphodiesterase class II)